MVVAGTTSTLRVAGFPSGHPAEQESNVKIRFVDQVLEVMSDYAIPLLNRLGGPNQFTTNNTKHEWVLYDTWKDRGDLDGSINSSVDTFDITPAATHRIPKGTILKIGTELMWVGLQTTGDGNTLVNVVRGYAGTTAAAHADAAEFRMVGFAEVEGQDFVLRGSALRTVPFNYHAIFKTGSSESFAQQESNVYTRRGPTMNEMMADTISQYAVLLEAMLIEGERYEGASDTAPPSFGGLRFFGTSANGATIVDASGALLSRSLLNTGFEGSYDAVGQEKMGRTILCGKNAKTRLYEEFGMPIVRAPQGASSFSENVTMLENEFGRFDVIGPFKRIPSDELWIVNIALIRMGKYGTLGRLHEVLIPTSGDYTSRGLYAMNTVQIKGIPGLVRIHNFTTS